MVREAVGHKKRSRVHQYSLNCRTRQLKKANTKTGGKKCASKDPKIKKEEYWGRFITRTQGLTAPKMGRVQSPAAPVTAWQNKVLVAKSSKRKESIDVFRKSKEPPGFTYRPVKESSNTERPGLISQKAPFIKRSQCPAPTILSPQAFCFVRKK